MGLRKDEINSSGRFSKRQRHICILVECANYILKQMSVQSGPRGASCVFFPGFLQGWNARGASSSHSCEIPECVSVPGVLPNPPSHTPLAGFNVIANARGIGNSIFPFFKKVFKICT